MKILAVECFVLLAGVIQVHTLESLQAQTLSDVDIRSYEGQASSFLQKRGIISGFPDGTFRGSEPVNRVQAAKMLLLAADYTLTNYPNDGSFPDIEKGTWYEQFALNAVQHGLMNGYPDGSFGPARTVLRSEFLKMLSNAFQLQQGNPYHYVDVPQDAWFAQFAGAAEEKNLFLHDKAQLLPAAPMSRDEVSWAIYQMLIYRTNNLIIRTPFDYIHTAQVKVPTEPVHAAPPPEPSSSASSQAPVFPPVASSSQPAQSTSSVQKITYCDDTDANDSFPNGFNQNAKGVARNLLISNGNNLYEDVCAYNSNILYEYYCNEQGYVTRQQINCPVYCDKGACTVEESGTEGESGGPPRPTSTISTASSAASQSSAASVCTDTDSTHRYTDGYNVYAKGTANGLLPDKTKGSLTDICDGQSGLKEFYCASYGSILEYNVTCPLGCQDGACISPGTVGTCTDEDADSGHPDGLNFAVQSRIFVEHPEEGNYTEEDYCESPTMLNEFTCGPGGRVVRYLEACNCLDGACVEEEEI